MNNKINDNVSPENQILKKSSGIISQAIGVVKADPIVNIRPITNTASRPSFNPPFCQFFVKAYIAPIICNSKIKISIIFYLICFKFTFYLITNIGKKIGKSNKY